MSPCGKAKVPCRALRAVAICAELPASDSNGIDRCAKGLNRSRPGLALHFQDERGRQLREETDGNDGLPHRKRREFGARQFWLLPNEHYRL